MKEKITPNPERARSLLEMAENTDKYLKELIAKFSQEENQSIIAREYYEVIRELISAILIADGFKIFGESAHKETVEYLKNFKQFSEQEISEIQDLRVKRNDSSYEGKQIKKPYIQNKKDRFDSIINKLQEILNNKLK